jgi:hypothetical protein
MIEDPPVGIYAAAIWSFTESSEFAIRFVPTPRLHNRKVSDFRLSKCSSFAFQSEFDRATPRHGAGREAIVISPVGGNDLNDAQRAAR